ncbi:MAG: prepilin-type N-terminal cleavage/methylation domain-containing protein [Clostridiales Family XIII bacterium]|jgi:prepilin-type N-terminal cleavage/methylation domain-containing protein|nr:prepilin-type N-terminal cleavage/methylation domain-containing protein [Clostridiales Family XIII bacterium]
MNMILKKRFASRRNHGGALEFPSLGGVPRSGGVVSRHKGFTLVEVIVVLVILAILAAIAIPALTGYIDKAKWAGIVQQGRTQMTALQVMITDQKTMDGGFTSGSGIAGSYFQTVKVYPNYCKFEKFTEKGLREYEKLTGDSASFASDRKSRPEVVTSLDGAIYFYSYLQDHYFKDQVHLIMLYIRDTNSKEAGEKAFIDKYINWVNTSCTLKGEFKSGWSIFKQDDTKVPNPVFERVY